MLRIFIEEPNLFCDPTHTYITESCHTISHRTSLRHGGVTGDTHGKCKNYTVIIQMWQITRIFYSQPTKFYF